MKFSPPIPSCSNENFCFHVGDYSFGFNGAEKADISKELYIMDFRIVDSRIGRWFSTDPVIHSFQSPYNGFDNNPISILDPSGADGEGDKGTGKLQATVYFKFDEDSRMTPQEQQEYVENFACEVRDQWNSYSLSDGTNVNVDDVVFALAPTGMSEADLKPLENLLTVGNGKNAKESTVANKTSYINGNRLRNTGYMFETNDLNEMAAHEFGHLFGLSDRYAEGIFYDPRGHLLSDRFTIPLMIGSDTDYRPFDNLYSSGTSLTQQQLDIVFNRDLKEAQYTSVVLVHPSASQSLPNYSAVEISRRVLGYSVRAFDSNANYNRGLNVQFAKSTFFGFVCQGPSAKHSINCKHDGGNAKANRKMIRSKQL